MQAHTQVRELVCPICGRSYEYDGRMSAWKLMACSAKCWASVRGRQHKVKQVTDKVANIQEITTRVCARCNRQFWSPYAGKQYCNTCVPKIFEELHRPPALEQEEDEGVFEGCDLHIVREKPPVLPSATFCVYCTHRHVEEGKNHCPHCRYRERRAA